MSRNTNFFTFLTSLTLAGAGPAVAGGQGQVEAGLWETQLSGDFVQQVGGYMQQAEAEIAKMPPEMQAQMRAMIASQMASLQEPEKMCITPEDAEKGIAKMMEDDNGLGGEDCTQDVSWEGNHGVVTMKCQDGATGRGDINVKGGKTISMAMVFTDTAGKTTTLNWDGRWLGRDCGDVKPD